MNALRRVYSITKHIFQNFNKKHKVSLGNPKKGDTIWQIFISPMNFLLFTMVTMILMLIIATSIIIYTPIIDTLPGYRNIKSREMIIEAVMRIDSLKNEIAVWNDYRDNIINIMDGKAPEPMEIPTTTDTTKVVDRKITPRSKADSLFRSAIQDSLAINGNKFSDKKSSYELYTPVQGIVSNKYNLSKDSRAIEVSATSYSPVLSIDRGNVIFTSWSPEEGYIIQIQHGDGMISIYKLLSSSIVSVGENIAAGEVVGYIGEENPERNSINNTAPTLKLEMWKEGNSINPENYLSF